jgi:hypothetical protein
MHRLFLDATNIALQKLVFPRLTLHQPKRAEKSNTSRKTPMAITEHKGETFMFEFVVTNEHGNRPETTAKPRHRL